MMLLYFLTLLLGSSQALNPLQFYCPITASGLGSFCRSPSGVSCSGEVQSVTADTWREVANQTLTETSFLLLAVHTRWCRHCDRMVREIGIAAQAFPLVRVVLIEDHYLELTPCVPFIRLYVNATLLGKFSHVRAPGYQALTDFLRVHTGLTPVHVDPTEVLLLEQRNDQRVREATRGDGIDQRVREAEFFDGIVSLAISLCLWVIRKVLFGTNSF